MGVSMDGSCQARITADLTACSLFSVFGSVGLQFDRNHVPALARTAVEQQENRNQTATNRRYAGSLTAVLTAVLTVAEPRLGIWPRGRDPRRPPAQRAGSSRRAEY